MFVRTGEPVGQIRPVVAICAAIRVLIAHATAARRMGRLIAVPASATLANNVIAMANAYLPDQWTAGATTAMPGMSAGAMAGACRKGRLIAGTLRVRARVRSARARSASRKRPGDCGNGTVLSRQEVICGFNGLGAPNGPPEMRRPWLASRGFFVRQQRCVHAGRCGRLRRWPLLRSRYAVRGRALHLTSRGATAEHWSWDTHNNKR